MSNNNIPQFTIRQMLESGVHYGHKKNRWNPQMSQFIFGTKDNLHIIDLTKTYSLLNEALSIISKTAQNNGKILFIGTKKQLSNTIATNAQKCNQHYVNYRWLGGMLTNWTTVSNSIKTLEEIETSLAQEESCLTKKERLTLTRKQEKLNKSLGGIRNLNNMPALVIIFDTTKESNAVHEAHKLGIPIIAVVDTNSSLKNITHPIPGNDDSAKAANFFCDLFAQTINKVSKNIANQDTAPDSEIKPIATDNKVKDELPESNAEGNTDQAADKAEPKAKATTAKTTKAEPKAKATTAKTTKAEPKAKATAAKTTKAEPKAKATAAKKTAKAEPKAKATAAKTAKAEPKAKATAAKTAKAEPKAKATTAKKTKAEPKAKATAAKKTAKAEPKAKATAAKKETKEAK